MQRKTICKYENWDDTFSPYPVCHCLKSPEDIICLNVYTNDEALCPNYKPLTIKIKHLENKNG